MWDQMWNQLEFTTRSMATTSASHVAVTSMIAVKVRCAKVDMKTLNENPMNLKSLIGGVVIAVVALIAVLFFTRC